LLLLAQKKVTKEKSTPCRLFPPLLSHLGGNQELANKVAWLKQLIAESSQAACVARRGRGVVNVKTILLRHSRKTVKVFPVEYTS